VEPRRRVESGDRPGGGVTRRDALDRGEMPSRCLDVEIGPERPCPLLVEPGPRAESRGSKRKQG